MNISAVPLTPEDLPHCGALWPDRAGFTQPELARALATCAALVRDRRALGSLIREGQRVRAYGISAFVEESFAEDYLGNPHPQIGKRLLLENADSRSVLTCEGVAARNAGSGLQLVVVSTNYDVTACEPMLVVGVLIRTFMEVHRGHRIARIINEVIGDAAVDVMTRSGVYDLHACFPEIAPNISIPSAVGVLTRATAETRRSALVGMFAYNPPRALFTPAQQRLLEAALDGAPDETVSSRLGVPLTAVKARWTRIYQRVIERVPELVAHVRAPHPSNRRGAQIRHLVLEYIRHNPSELTPYAARSNRR